MKIILILTSFILLSFTNVKDEPLDRIGIKGPLEFNKENYKLSWSAKPNENYYVQEYLPKGETTERYNQMLTIHLFITNLDTKEAVEKKVNELETRKKTDPICNYSVNESPDGKEFMVDFLMGESKGDEMTVAEFNVYYYKKIALDNSKNGIIVYSYTKRSYGEEITKFLKNLGKDRTNFLNQMISTEIPTVKI